MDKHKTLILDATAIKKLVNIKDAIKAIEDVFRQLGEGNTRMPPKLYLPLPEFDGDFRAMPAWVKNLEGCVIKWVSVYPKNKNLPTVIAIMILSDPKSGLPLCVMDATYLTSLRTGAAGGVAAKYLARKESKKIALVGCGVQAKTQLAALLCLFNIREVRVWGFRPNEAETFIRKFKTPENIKMNVSSTVKDCVEDSDIVVTTTPSRKPLLRLEWVKKGAHINAIGADAQDKQELDPRILKKAKVVVDDLTQASHSGEINVPLRKGVFKKEEIWADIGQIVARKKKARTAKNEITIFDSTGLAIQDAAIANLAYKKALRFKLGQRVDFIS